jgi:hypothetical protein
MALRTIPSRYCGRKSEISLCSIAPRRLETHVVADVHVPVLPLEAVAVHAVRSRAIDQLPVAGGQRKRGGNSREGNAEGLLNVKGLEVATNIPSLALLLGLVGNEVGKVVVGLERRRDTGTARVLERIALDGVRDGGARETAAVVGVGAVGSKVDLEDLLGVRVDDDVEVQGVSVSERGGKGEVSERLVSACRAREQNVQVVVFLSASVDKSLLQTTVPAETMLVSDGPAIAHNLLLGNPWEQQRRSAPGSR